MFARILFVSLLSTAFCAGDSQAAEVKISWGSSGVKIAPDRALPLSAPPLVIRTARNEAEAAQLVILPSSNLEGLTLAASSLKGPRGAEIPASAVEILEVRCVNVTTPTDKSSTVGLWADPLPPLKEPLDLPAGKSKAFWVRLKPGRETPAGIYKGNIKLEAQAYSGEAAVEVEVFDFALPDRMSCTTAFGFSHGNVFRYHGLKNSAQKRLVLDKYFANFADHHISPYNPAPLDGIRVDWPDIKPIASKWQGGMNVQNETHSGDWALLVNDDDPDSNTTAVYRPLIEIPPAGLRLKFWFRTAVPGHMFLVTLNHYDADREWIYGGNNDMGIEGSGKWQLFDRTIKKFPDKAGYVRLNLRATLWTDAGEKIGLTWFDQVSLTNPESGEELIEGGQFGPPPLPPFEPEKLEVKIDFSNWDRAMSRGIDHYKFNSFRLGIPGLGGGTFHSRREPSLLGFGEESPHYKYMFKFYCSQMQEHLRDKGWLDEAFIYWFDEPAPRDYDFVNNGFAKLKAACPDIRRMLTEQVEPELIGGPDIWCPVSSNYDHESAKKRREEGEKFWWYVCTGPKAPYCTLFIDHPATELRVWLWQTYKRKIAGILVWQTNYWTSSAAYPDKPQNPYEDPMGWRSGYSTPKGEKRPWGNGDGRFIYPPVAAADANPKAPVLDGPVDSIRWEMLRDGIEDYEYLIMLEKLIAAKSDKIGKGELNRLESLLEVPAAITSSMTTFTKDPAPIGQRRLQIARAIAFLSKL